MENIMNAMTSALSEGKIQENLFFNKKKGKIFLKEN